MFIKIEELERSYSTGYYTQLKNGDYHQIKEYKLIKFTYDDNKVGYATVEPDYSLQEVTTILTTCNDNVYVGKVDTTVRIRKGQLKKYLQMLDYHDKLHTVVGVQVYSPKGSVYPILYQGKLKLISEREYGFLTYCEFNGYLTRLKDNVLAHTISEPSITENNTVVLHSVAGAVHYKLFSFIPTGTYLDIAKDVQLIGCRLPDNMKVEENDNEE